VAAGRGGFVAKPVNVNRNRAMKIIAYQASSKAFARKLRREMTLAEVLLWNQLKRRQMLGYDFDRQRPIGKYVVDFYCKELRLAVEVDGRSHDVKEQSDRERQRELEELGVAFLRFWDAEVKRDMRGVLARLAEGIRHRELALGMTPREGNPPRPAGTPPEEGNSEHAG
jgi:very-short-patch-repair endonuclease